MTKVTAYLEAHTMPAGIILHDWDSGQSTLSAGAYGFLEASVSWNANGITNWYFDIDVSLHGAIIIGRLGKLNLVLENNMELQYIIIPAFFLCIILLNVAIGRHTINKALREFIIPKLKAKGMAFQHYKWVGFLGPGDFTEEKNILQPNMTGGRPVISTYIYIYYIDSGITKRITVKIETLFIFIRRVTYSSEL